MNFIEVSSDYDYGACTFEGSIWANKKKELFQQAMEQGGCTCITISTDDGEDGDTEIQIKALTFGEVPDDFFQYVMNELCDYDMLKNTNIYKVEEE